MDTILDLYKFIFNLEMALLGIVSACLFVFVQLIYTRFPSREIRRISSMKLLYIFLFIIISSLAISAIGSFLLSLGKHDFFKNYDFGLKVILEDPGFLLLNFLLFTSSIILSVFVIKYASRYLQSNTLIKAASKSITYKEILNFLFQKYGLQMPYKQIIVSFDYIKPEVKELEERIKEGIIKNEQIDIDETEEAKKIKEKLAHEEVENDTRYENEVRRYNKLHRNLRQPKGTLTAFTDLGNLAILNSDRGAFNEYLVGSLEIFSDFIIHWKQERETVDGWDPHSDLIEKYVKYISELWLIQLNNTQNSSLPDFTLEILHLSKKFAELLITEECSAGLVQIFRFWKLSADKFLFDEDIFKRVMVFFRESADPLIDDSDKFEKALTEMLKNIGWLGERLLNKREMEKKPLMPDEDFSTSFDELLECILSISALYNDEYPEQYPLIFFDVIDVVRLAMTTNQAKKEGLSQYKFNEILFSLNFAFLTFAKNGIIAENRKGAELATLKLTMSFESLASEERTKKEAEDCIKLLAELGLYSSSFEEKLKDREGFLGESIPNRVISSIEKYPLLHGVLDSEILELYLRQEGDRDKSWQFIAALGKKLHTSFGLMFDWKTGLRYEKDDPRRT